MPLPKYSLKIFGRFELSGRHGPIELPSKKLAALLAYLVCCAPRPQSREKLASLLWGSHFDIQARQNLRQALSRLRRVLGPDVVIGEGDVVALAPGRIDCDAIRLEQLAGDGRPASLAEAGDLYRDMLLADITIPEETWAEWLGTERSRFEHLALDLMIRHAEEALRSGEAETALKAANRAIAVNALREDAHRLVIQALAATGRKAEALKHYRDLVALLKRELNTEPDAVTRSLVSVLRAAVSDIEVRAGRAPEQERDSAEAAASGGAAPPAGTDRQSRLGRRQLTIMVCNMVGSASFAANLDAEEFHDLVAAFNATVADAVARFAGFVAQYQNNGVVVYFGYPTADEHDAERAVRAGLALVDAVRLMKTPVPATLEASVGIATGSVVIGEDPGSGDMRQRVAIGETPNLAARLQATATPGQIVISANTQQLVGRLFDSRALRANEVNGLARSANGLAQSVGAWLVLGERAGVSRFEARHVRGLSPLLGRHEEIDLLLRRWEQAKRGEGRVVLLSGEPGIGKSRIAENLIAALDGEPHSRLRYFCSPHHTHSPLHPFIAQLEHVAGFDPGSSAAAKLDRLEALLEPTSKNLPRDVVLIAELLGVPMDGRFPALTLSPPQKRDMTRTALLDQLDGMAARGPVLVVVEDAHWLDPTSLDLIDRRIAGAADLPMLLVMTFRPEFEPTWIGQPHVTLLPLSRLRRDDCAGIIEAIAGDKVLPEAVVEQVLSRADGVPLFIEELTRTLLESQVLCETADRYLLDGPLPPRAIPTTLQDSLVARFDRLGPGKDVALIGAAIGRDFSQELVAAVSGLPATELDAALERLVGSGLVVRRGTPPDATYSFRHALVQDAAYVTMLKGRRRQLHASIARVLVERFPAVSESQPEVVARHFTEADLSAEAIDFWVRAGRLAFARWANREAVTFFEMALRILASLPETAPTMEQAFDIRLELPRVILDGGLGQGDRVLEHLREAERLAERLNDDSRRSRVWSYKTVLHVMFSQLDEALETGTRALEIAQRLGDLKLRLSSSTLLTQVLYRRADYEAAVALAAANLAALPSDRIFEDFGLAVPPSILDRAWMTQCLSELGRFGEAGDVSAEAIRLAGESRHPYAVVWAQMGAGTARMLRGDWAEARADFEQAMSVLTEASASPLLPAVTVVSAWIFAQLGESEMALTRLREAERLLERHASSGYTGVLGLLYMRLGRAALALGLAEEAARMGGRALEYAARQPGFMAHTLYLLGDVAAHPDRFDAESSEAHFRNALALAEPRGMRPLVAHCQFGLGKLYRRMGQRKRADEHLVVARTMYAEMDMPFWRDEADAAIGGAARKPSARPALSRVRSTSS